MNRTLVLHGHFYQPPRENPWTERIDRQKSASPFHDWNERVHSECYRANAYARIFDPYHRVSRIRNNYADLNFDFGPTLLSWMERRHPRSYSRILEADRASVVRHRGHGAAIAHTFNHAILPLCSDRDRRTQILWGLADFRHRFGRDSEGFWIPETACDVPTLAALIDHGIRYTILAPRQARRVRRSQQEWIEVSRSREKNSVSPPALRTGATNVLDPGKAYRFFHPDGSGRSLAVFFYDGALAQAIAFDGGLSSTQVLVEHVRRAAEHTTGLIHAATDGETYGHHGRFGDLALAFALQEELGRSGFETTTYGAFLEQHPPVEEVEIDLGDDGLGSSWSCIHGIGRWHRDCGCMSNGQDGWVQAWREPLRKGLDVLRDSAALMFEEDAGEAFDNPWAVRDAYIEVLLDPRVSRGDFLRRHARGPLSRSAEIHLLSLLELQRHSLLMYTSCAWFFSDLAGIETVQGMRYAGRVLELLEECGATPPRDAFFAHLGVARSNDPAEGNGIGIFERAVAKSRVSPRRMAAHLAMSSLAGSHVTGADPREALVGGERRETAGAGAAEARSGERLADGDDLGAFVAREHITQLDRYGRYIVATGRIVLEAKATGRTLDAAYCVVHLGGMELYCFVRDYADSPLREGRDAMRDALRDGLPRLMRTAQEQFGSAEYGVEHLLPAGREQLSSLVFSDLVAQFREQYRHLYEDHRPFLDKIQSAGFALPPELKVAAEITLGRLFEEEVLLQAGPRGEHAYRRALEIAEEADRRGYRIDSPRSSEVFGARVEAAVLAAISGGDVELEEARHVLELVDRLGVSIRTERTQEYLYQAIVDRGQDLLRIYPLAVKLGLSPELFLKNRVRK